MTAHPLSAGPERTTSRPRASGPAAVLGEGEIHVWQGTLDDADPARSEVTPGEAARARSLGSERRRREFLVCRGALRRILADVLGASPLSIPLREGAHGKPALAPHPLRPPGRSAIGFNVSHSGDRFVIAVARGLEPGIDIERIRPRRDLAGLARRRCFSAAEQRALALAPDQVHAFHRIWARKEAVIKADGRGVSVGLDRFDVSAGEVPVLIDVRWGGAVPGEAARWTLFTLDAGPDYAGALAVRSAAAKVVRRADVPRG